MKIKSYLFLFLICFVLMFSISYSGLKAQDFTPVADRMIKLENPISVMYLKSHLKKSSPRLILTPSIEKELKMKIKTDPVVKN